jgi:hypothetical protein
VTLSPSHWISALGQKEAATWNTCPTKWLVSGGASHLETSRLKCGDSKELKVEIMEQFVVHLKEKKMALKVGLFSRFV